VAERATPDLAFRRVLVIRLSAIGDVVFASPLIEAIKRARPDAETYWLAESTVAPVLTPLSAICPQSQPLRPC